MDHTPLSPCKLVAPSLGTVSLYICSLEIFLLASSEYHRHRHHHLEQHPVRWMQGGHANWGDSQDGASDAVQRKQTLYLDMGPVLQHLWASCTWDFSLI